VKSDIRLITATNRNLDEMVAAGAFRKDLFYRIHVMPFHIPPLRERKNDIPLLVDHFIERYNHLYGKQVSDITAETLAVLMTHDFPGNIRELENILQHAFILSLTGKIEKKHLPAYLEKPALHQDRPDTPFASPLEYETERIMKSLEANHYNRKETALSLGVHPATLWRKMKKLGIPFN